MGCDIRHPRIPKGLGRVGRAEKVEGEEVASSRGIRDEDCGADDEGGADSEGGLPAGLDSVRGDGVEDCANDGECVDGGRVVVLLNDSVPLTGHPIGHYVVPERLNAERINLIFALDFGGVWKRECMYARMKRNGRSQNCQVRRTRRKTVKSQFCFRDFPNLLTAWSFSSSVRYHALRWCGKLGMKNHPASVSPSSSTLLLST